MIFRKFLTSFFLLFFFIVSAKSASVTNENIEMLLMMRQSKKVLQIANAELMENTGNPLRIDALRAYKVEALVQMELYLEAVRLASHLLKSKTLEPEMKLRIYLQQALIYEIIGEMAVAESSLKRALQVLNKHPDLMPKYYTSFLVRKSSLLRVGSPGKNYEKAIDSAIAYGKSVSDTYNTSVAYMVKAFAHRDRKDFQQAINFLHASLQTHKKFKDADGIASMYLNLAGAYIELKQYRRAELYADSAIAKLDSIESYSTKAWGYEVKSNLEELQHRPASALYYYKIFTELAGREDFAKKQISIKEFELNMLRDREILHNKQLVAENRRLFILLIISFLVAGVLLYLIRNINRKRIEIEDKKKYISENAVRLERMVEEKSFLVKELNHRVKNNLAVILSLIDLQADEIKDPQAKVRFHQLHSRVETIAMAHKLYSYEKNEGEDATVDLEEYFQSILQIHHQSSPRKFGFTFSSVSLDLSMDTVIPLGMILNELITNSIKHAIPDGEQELRIVVETFFADNCCNIIYKDNGVNFINNASLNSFGMFILDTMISQIGANYMRQNSTYTINFQP